MRVLVTGASGYIGGYVVAALRRAGHEPLPLDEDLLGLGALPRGLDAVIHLAALIDAQESLKAPAAYWATNVSGTVTLLNAALAGGTPRVIFASSAAAAEPGVYGETKLIGERMLGNYAAAYGLKTTALRLFNVAGGKERHRPETHIIPRALFAAASGETLALYGDGGAVRDYVHVEDVARAFVAALDCDIRGPLDIGTGLGSTVNQVIECVQEVTGREVKVDRRAARQEPSWLVAEPGAAWQALDWRPLHSLRDCIASTWESWEERV